MILNDLGHLDNPKHLYHSVNPDQMVNIDTVDNVDDLEFPLKKLSWTGGFIFFFLISL